MANTILPQPWVDPTRPDPTNISLSPYVAELPVLTRTFTKGDTSQEAIDSEILRQYKGARYKNMGANSKRKLVALKRSEELTRYIERSKFFTTVDDGEDTNKAGVETNTFDNPRFLLSKVNEEELESKLNNPNSINKRVMTDTGTGEFQFNPPDADQVGIVRSSNQSFVDRRDMYFIQPQPPGVQGVVGDVPEKNIEEFLQEQQLDAQGKMNSQRRGLFKSRRRR